MQVYSSFSNVMNFERSKIPIPSIYKRYALMYDQIIFNRYGCPIGKNDFFKTLPDYTSTLASDESDLKNKLTLGKNKKFRDLFIDMWDLVEDPEKTHQEARNYVSDFDQSEVSKFSWGRNLIDEQMGIHNHHKEYKAAAIVGGDISSDLGFNFLLNEKLKAFKINLAPVVSDALKTAHESPDIKTLFTTDLVIPNFEELSWDQILELREDKYIKEFRDKILSCNGEGGSIDEIIAKDLNNSLWQLADQCKPNMKKTILEVLLSNLPSPTIVNPFGLYYGAKSIQKTNVNQNTNSWVYFVQSMKKVN